MATPIIYQNSVLIPEGEAGVLREAGMGLLFETQGHRLRAIPHTDATTRLMWNMGFHDTPSPMTVGQNFDWPGKFTPMAHQRKAAQFMVVHKRCFNLSGLGTGKTASAIWAAEWLLRTKQVRKVLVVAPLSCLRRVWEDEILRLTPMRGVTVAHGDKKKRAKALAADVSYVVINHDGVKTELTALLADEDFDLVIVDEFTAFKTHNSDRSKAMRSVAKNRRLWMMSGTPSPQSPMDAYFPCKIVNPDLPYNMTRFRDMVMLHIPPYKWLPRRNAVELVRRVMQPAILIKKEDVLDLPPTTYVRREVPLTAPQVAALAKLRREKLLRTETGSGTHQTSTAVNAAALASKLMQITQGALIQDDGSRLDFDATPRVQETINLIHAAEAKSIVFAPYIGSLDLLKRELGAHYKIGVVSGSVSANERNDVYREFQDGTDVDVLIAHPKTTAHGLTLTAADLTVWYGPTGSTETYLQANQRMNRPGQTRPMTIAHLGGTAAEWALYDALEGNANLQQTLLDLYDTY